MLETEELINEVVHTEFEKAIKDGILEMTEFKLGGVKMAKFTKSLQSLSANRYLHYIGKQEFYINNGIDKNVDTEYTEAITARIEAIKELLVTGGDIKAKVEELDMLHKVYSMHKKDINFVYMMLDFMSIVLILPSENPYLLDPNKQADKIEAFYELINGENGEEFSAFFWKYISMNEVDWVQQLMQLTGFMGREEEAKMHLEKKHLLIAWDILDVKEQLQLWRQKKGLSKLAKSLRIIYNLASTKLNTPIFSRLLNTNS